MLKFIVENCKFIAENWMQIVLWWFYASFVLGVVIGKKIKRDRERQGQ